MRVLDDPTVDPALRSWVESADGSDFPVQSLPYGVFSAGGGPPRVGVAIGNLILDLAEVADRGLLEAVCPDAREVFAAAELNPFMARGRPVWRAVRRRLSDLLRVAPTERAAGTDCSGAGGADGSDNRAGPVRSDPARRAERDDPDALSVRRAVEDCLVDRASAAMHLPFAVADYVDFYSSIHHATNVGRMFRPEAEPLLPNWRHLPVGYHGRAGTVLVSGTPILRPRGQRRIPAPGPHVTVDFGPTGKLDFELEVGFVVGTESRLGRPVTTTEAGDHVFGCVLVNDWSARDLQAWEAQPLGPFLAKSFATSISAWVVPLDALGPSRVNGPPQEPAPQPYLVSPEPWAFDLDLEVWLRPAGQEAANPLSRVGFAGQYWTMAQQLAHLTVNGASLRTGDLFASGTVSGPGPNERGSLLELSWNGERPLSVGGQERTFLEDGDEVVMRASTGAGGVKVTLGEVSGVVLPDEPVPLRS